MSARIGGNSSLTQGAGGNTSIKIGDILWVKASGCRLSDALRRPIFVGLSLDAVHRELAAEATDERFESATAGGLQSAGLRPSIETALHAVLPHPAVVHAHSVNCTTASILADGRQRIGAALGSFCTWDWIPYLRPGLPLAIAVKDAWNRSRADVYILQNHGVVVGAADCESAERVLMELERRLSFIVRPPARKERTATLNSDHYEFSHSDAAYDAQTVAFLTAAARFPDQVVFLGGPVPRFPDCASADRRAAPPAYALVDGVGLLAARDRPPPAEIIMDALLAIAMRIPPGAAVTGLTPDHVGELLGWEAEHHRLAMSRQA